MGVVQGRLATTWPVVRSEEVALLGLGFSLSISIFKSGMGYMAGIYAEHSTYIHGESGVCYLLSILCTGMITEPLSNSELLSLGVH